MRFLISRLSSLGDVVCSLPAAGALKAAFPNGEVTWICDPRFSAVVRACRHVDLVVEAKPGLSPSSWPALEGEFEAAFDLQGLLKSAIPVARAKAKRKLGYHWQREGAWLFSRPVTPDPTSLHIVDQYVDVARAAGGQADRADFGLAPRSEDLKAVFSKFPWLKGSESPMVGGTPPPPDSVSLTSIGRTFVQNSHVPRFVVLNAGAGWATKRWPAAHFARVADALAEKGIQSVLIGGIAPADREAADAVLEQSAAKSIDLLGKTSIGELIALLSLAEAHVGGDTGSTHLMAALGRPAVGLYSITRPKRSCPYGQIERCHYDPDSLANISPEQVLGTLEEVLN